MGTGCTMDLYHTAYSKLVDVTKRTSGHVFYIPNNKTGLAGKVNSMLNLRFNFFFKSTLFQP